MRFRQSPKTAPSSSPKREGNHLDGKANNNANIPMLPLQSDTITFNRTYVFKT